MSDENGNVDVSATETQTNTAESTSSTETTESVDTQETGTETTQVAETDSKTQDAGTEKSNEDSLDKFSFNENLGFNDEQKKNALDVMKSFGVSSKSQADNVVKFLDNLEKARLDAENKSKEEMLERWDKALDEDKEFSKDYDANIDLANKALKQYGGQELDSWLTKTGFNRHPEIVKMFYRIGKDLADAKVLTSNSTSANVLQHDKYGNAKFNLTKSFGDKN